MRHFFTDGFRLYEDHSCHRSVSSPRSDALQSWEVAQSWIMNCVVNHPHRAHLRIPSGQRPSRLVFIGVEANFSDVRLCSNNEIEPNAFYVTLSHCWGRAGLGMKLTSISQWEFGQKIPWERLPGTFRDAILVTRKLRVVFGVQYIWIDALCIIQDNLEDWRREASKMRDIYYHSFCNLAACVGQDSYSGLLNARSSFASHTCVIEANINGESDTRFQVSNRDSFYTEVQQCYLESRAWVLQEILLAPRILYFAPQKLYWECASLCAHEDAPSTPVLGYPIKQSVFDSPLLVSPTVNEKNDSVGADYRLYRIWMNAVNSYTKRKLTRPEDKLVAISGLAERISAKFTEKDIYIAGLWKRNLLLQMLWRVRDGHQTLRPEPYRAPTWSWASVEGTVYNHRTNQEAVQSTYALAEVIDLSIKHRPDDIFGQIQSAKIRLRAPLICISLDFPTRSPQQLTTGAQLMWEGRPFTKFGEDIVDLDFEMSATTQPSRSYCMPLIVEKSNNGNSETIICLLLQPKGDSRGLYERFGICDLETGVSDVLEEAKAITLSEEEHLGYCGNGIFTIDII